MRPFDNLASIKYDMNFIGIRLTKGLFYLYRRIDLTQKKYSMESYSFID
jgi:hypothetical protein